MDNIEYFDLSTPPALPPKGRYLPYSALFRIRIHYLGGPDPALLINTDPDPNTCKKLANRFQRL
jgi:hypothetical protein